MRLILLTLIAVVMLFQPAYAPAVAAEPGADEYARWLKRPGNLARVQQFERELEARELMGIVPTYQILRTALSWKQCNAAPFELPDRRFWPGAFESLRVLKNEIKPILGPVAIVSGYRHSALNQCAGGAKGSVHRNFGAFDVFAIGPITRDDMIEKLCQWHRHRGAELEAGLGIYRLKKFHLDVGVRGNRRWGSDYTRKSSPC